MAASRWSARAAALLIAGLSLAGAGCKSTWVVSDPVELVFVEDDRTLAEATFRAHRVDWEEEPEIGFLGDVHNTGDHEVTVELELFVAGEGGTAFGPARFAVDDGGLGPRVPAGGRASFGVAFHYPPDLEPRGVTAVELELVLFLVSDDDVLTVVSNPFQVYWEDTTEFGVGVGFHSGWSGGAVSRPPKSTYRPAPVPRRP